MTEPKQQWQKLDGTPAESDTPLDWTANPFLAMKHQLEMTPEMFAKLYLGEWTPVPKNEREANKCVANRHLK